MFSEVKNVLKRGLFNKVLIVLAFCCFGTSLHAQQKEGNIWYFGTKAGIDFNDSIPKVLTNGELNTHEGCATICNKYGNLLFYTDGTNVYNKTHTLMPNGTGLHGDPSSTQSGIIVPNPSDPSIYYVFSISAYTTNGLCYSEIDTILNGGLGDVNSLKKNICIMPNGTEKLNAVKHSNGVDTWVVSHQRGNNSFYAFLVTANGVSNSPVVSKVGSNFNGISAGYLKFSPDASKIVAAQYLAASESVEMFDFDNTTGVVSNPQTLISNSQSYYGVEFSASGRFLYVTKIVSTPNLLVQFDMSLNNLSLIKASKKIIDTIGKGGALQLAPDGKIYMANSGEKWLGVINKPEESGKQCDFVKNGIDLTPRASLWGLPSFNQSFFYRPNAEIDFESPTCDNLTVRIFNIGDTANIIRSYWDFGDSTQDSGKVVMKTFPRHDFFKLSNIVHLQVKDTIIIDTLTRILRTHPLPQANFGTENYIQCFNQNYFEFRDSSKYLLGTRYSGNRWLLGTNSPKFPNTKVIARKFNNPGVYDIELIVESSDGCFDTLVKQVVVHPSPKADFQVSDSVQCLHGNSFNLQQHSTIDTTDTISVYNWSFNDNTSSNLQQPLKNYTDTGRYTISLETISTNGCIDTAYGTLTVHPNPTANYTISNICHTDTAKFQNQSVANTDGKMQYIWGFGNGVNGDTTAQPSHYYNDSGEYITYLKAINKYGCADSISKTIKVHPKPKADFTTSGSCTNNPVRFNNTSNLFGVLLKTTSWSLGDGKTATATNKLTEVYAKDGTKTIKLFIEDEHGCKDSLEKQIQINPQPQADFTTNQQEQCIRGNNFQFTNTSTIKSGSIAQNRWLENETQISLQPNTLKQYTQTGTYSIKLIAVSDSGCTDSVERKVIVNPNIKVAVIINDTVQCYKEHRFKINNNSQVNGTGTIQKYTWLFSDNTSQNTPSPTDKKFSTDGDYTVQCIMETDKGCLDTFSKALQVLYTPVPVFTAQEICFGDSVYFDNQTNEKDIERWLWDFGDGTKSVEKIPYRKYTATGNYEVKLIATTKDGCKDTGVVYFPNLVRPQPRVYFYDSLIDSYEQYTTYNFINGSANTEVYSWDFGDGTTSGAESSQKVYSTIGKFTVILTGTNKWGCEDQYKKELIVAPETYIYIPNAFSPDKKDNLNPVFKVDGLYYVNEIEVTVFNRWGEVVYHSTELGAAWDGTYKGDAVPEGAYLYSIRVLDLKNKLHVKRGTVTVIR